MSDIASPLGRVPSGVFILTAEWQGKRTGMLSSWVMQASFSPPMVTVAVHRERYLIPWLVPGTPVAINILADDEKDMISHFGRGFADPEQAFVGVDLLEDQSGAPVLADALGYLAGAVVSALDTGDHRLHAVEIHDGRMLREGTPMIHVRKNGLKY